MFAPKIAKAPTKAPDSPVRKLAPQPSTLEARYLGGGTVEQARMLQETIGNQATLRYLTHRLSDLPAKGPTERHEQEAASENMTAREASRSPSWDCSKIPVFSPERTNQSHVQSVTMSPHLPGNGSEPPLLIQAKLQTSSPGDPQEKEADQVAERVVALEDNVEFGDAAPLAGGTPSTTVSAGNWWDEVHRAAVDSEPLASNASVRDRLQARLGRGEKLSNSLKARMETGLQANFGDIRVHTDGPAAALARDLRAHAFAYGRDIFFAPGRFAPDSRAGTRLLAHELTHVIQQQAAPERIQRKDSAVTPPVTVTFYIRFEAQVTGPEFFTRAVMQYFEIGRTEAEQKIRDGKVTSHHPCAVTGVTPDLVGRDIGVSVQIAGMSRGEKAATVQRTAAIAVLPAAERKDLNDESDRRFWNRTNYKRGEKLGQGQQDEGARQLWLQTRESVLLDKEKVARLPPKVLNFLTGDGQRPVRPEDYRTALRIAEKVQGFSDADWALYKRRVIASTDDYERLERGVDAFRAQQVDEQRIMTRLEGQKNLYEQVKSYKALTRRMFTPRPRSESLPYSDPGAKESYEAAGKSLNDALKAAGFDSIQIFDDAITAYIGVFRRRAVELTLLTLQASERAVTQERQRYEQQATNDTLFAQLAPMRQATTEANQAFRQAMPTPQQLKTDSTNRLPSQVAAADRFREREAQAQQERDKFAISYPSLKDPELRTQALNVESAQELGALLRRNADDRLNSIQKTRVRVLNENEAVFKLDRIVAMTRQELGVAPGSAHDMAIKDYADEIKGFETFVQIAVGALALGLGLLTFGGGTVAVLAGAAGLAMSVQQANAEWEKYSAQRAAAHTSFDTALSVSSDDPSVVWVAMALIGVGLDGAALVSAMKAARPAIEIWKTTGNPAQFEAQLAKATQLSAGEQAALGRAARAQEQYEAALAALDNARRTRYDRLNALGDSEVFEKLIVAAYYAIKTNVTEFEVWLRTLAKSKFQKTINFEALTASERKTLEAAFNTAKERVASDAARLSVNVPFKAGQKVVTFDKAGQMLLDGKAVTQQQYKEVYKVLDLTHATAGHGPRKPLVDVMNEAKNFPAPDRSLSAADLARMIERGEAGGLSGKFLTDEALMSAVQRARAEWQVRPRTIIYLEALPNEARVFASVDRVPRGMQTMLPFDAPAGVVELQVRRIRAVFAPDGALTTIFPIGF